MDIIHLLPDSVANQIAAGEVIQRPASVVKELVENSIDAGARLVKVIITGAGRTSIQVIDDGKGMSETDARMAFERHATSKIAQAGDLFALATLGFRGEALASIAAVAQVELKTRTKDEELGTLIEISGSKVERQEPVQCAQGTYFTIKNLFFNVPARRKFLKSDETELRNIMQEMQRIVMAHPDVAFQLYNGNDLVYDLAPGGFKQRIINLFSKRSRNIAQQMVNVEIDTPLVKLSGYVGTPQSAGRNTPQFFFVNNRYMNHPFFRRAVLQAYERMIAPDDIPMFFLNLTVAPETIDVNIHPTKTEIKFENEREIWSIITIAVKESLGKFNIAPSIDFDTEGNIEIPTAGSNSDYPTTPQMPRQVFNPNYNPFGHNNFTGHTQSQPTRNWQQLFDETKIVRQNVSAPRQMSFETETLFAEDVTAGQNLAEKQETIVHRGQYLCISMRSGLMVINLPRAMTRIYYDDLMRNVEGQCGATQKLLFPEIVELSTDDKCLFTEIECELRAVGFDFTEFGRCMYKIEGVPALMSESSETRDVIDELLRNMQEGGSKVKDSIHNIIASTIALSAARTRSRQQLSDTERTSIIGRLFASSNMNNTPDGKPIIKVITDDMLNAWF